MQLSIDIQQYTLITIKELLESNARYFVFLYQN